MPTVRIDERGRITIPSEIRRRLGIRPGTELVVEVAGDGIVLKPIKRLRARDLLGVVGIEEVSIEEIEKSLGEVT